MGKTAVIFPGQGAQYVGMAKDFYDSFEDSKKVFDEADDVLDIELKKICFEENDDINKTEYTQPAMVAAEVAIYEHRRTQVSRLMFLQDSHSVSTAHLLQQEP